MTLLQPAAPSAENVLYLERRFDAPPTVVFRLWAAPAPLSQWWGPRDHYAHTVEVDFRPGGSWRTVVRSPLGEDSVMAGRYREIVDGQRIVFSFGLEGDGRDTLVTATFEDVRGTTRLGFQQYPLASLAELEANEATWGECFDRLESYLLREHWDNR